MHTTLLPDGWPRPKGYANGVSATGTESIYVGGQIGWNSQCIFETTDFIAQVRQALLNITDILRAAGAAPEHITRMTWYITDKEAYTSRLSELGAVYREVLGKHFPAMSVVVVAALIEDEALVEIEATAVK
ncbi:enamine deaminase RidA [Kineobactrum sediminis]|uniref:Enamine deaminase RidA n=1 Tax=Kineobactrum sediminis TaxID=1905677 RepID=A0A2N5Y1X7_9GAMM|nr:RidA family protein [Kineobactrum sediminis]PLW82394.1 enamine deaminase RidA [Kineobactrum sediminis]